MTKTPFVQLAGLALWGALSILTLPKLASAETHLKDFMTESGKCAVTERSDLLRLDDTLFPKYSYTLNETKIYQRRGLSPKTGTVIPPLTNLNCLAKSDAGRQLILVTGAKADDPFCGWVDIDNLIKANAENDLSFGADLEPCGRIKPIALSDFCSKMESLGTSVSACINESASRSVLNTKFITEKSNLYLTAQSTEVIDLVNIFTRFEVFDAVKNEAARAIRLLVGIEGTDLKGWLDYSSGNVLHSNLSVYFSASGSENIYQSEIGTENNLVLIARHKNLKQTLDKNVKITSIVRKIFVRVR